MARSITAVRPTTTERVSTFGNASKANAPNCQQTKGVTTLQTFLDAYIECALWSSTDDDGEPLDSQYGPEDIAPESLQQMRDDCEAFQRDNAYLLLNAGIPPQNGHDFWLTRNGHGAGFWDRGYPEVLGRKLTDAAHAYGESNLYVGDDGRLYIS